MSITAQNITKTFGKFTALNDVSLTVPDGKLVALLGPSGSGKTTLLRIIAGLEHADSGQILMDGEDTTDAPVKERNVGFVFQHYALFRHMTVFDNVAFGLRVKKRKDRPSKEEIAKRVHELLHLVQLDVQAKRMPHQLSGGQRQRVALARALAVQPRVLLLDEPFGALDAKVRKELRRWLRKLHEEIHVTSVFVTHDVDEALEVADEVVVMNHARIEQVGPPDELYEHPANPFVYNFLGGVNLLPLQESEGDGKVHVRPHDLLLLDEPRGVQALPAEILSIHAVGPVVRVELKLESDGSPLEAEIPSQEFKRDKWVPGKKVYVHPRKSINYEKRDPFVEAGV